MDTKEALLPPDLLEKTDVLCLFGFNSCDIESDIQKWSASKDRVALFIDTYDAHALEHFSELARARISQTFSYRVFPFLEGEEKALMQSLASQYQLLELHAHLEISEYQDFGVKVLNNLCKNYAKGRGAKDFHLLKDSLKGLPAFICGAGPSLAEATSFLQEAADKGVIFAGGAALGALTSCQVPVHIAAGIDPDPSQERCQMQGSFDAPFFYQGRFSSNLLEKIQGPLFQVPVATGIRIEDDPGFFDGGCTVTTFCVALAIHLGCSPIILVGVDLAYGDEKKKYVQSLPQENNLAPFSYEDCYTQKDWVIAAKWLEHMAATHSDVPFYKVGHQGLTMKGIHKSSFSELELPSFDIAAKIHALKLQSQESDLSTLERHAKVEAMRQSLKDSLSHIENLLLLFQEAYPEDPSSRGPFILHLFALYNEIVYQHLLEPLWKVWKFPLERNAATKYEKKIHQWLFFQRVLQEHLR